MDVFTALSVPARRKIIELLATRGRLSATGIAKHFTMSAPAVSQHLKVLRETKLVRVEKEGQRRIYKLDMSGMREFELWGRKMTWLWNSRFDALDRMLEIERERLKNEEK